MSEVRHSVEVRLTGPGGINPRLLRPEARLAQLAPLYTRYRDEALTGVEIAGRLGISPGMARSDMRRLGMPPLHHGAPAGEEARRRSALALAARAKAQHERIATRTEKPCKPCGRTLPLEAFGRDSRTADGLQCKCRECCNRLQRERRSQANGHDPEQGDGPVKRCRVCAQLRPMTAFPAANGEPCYSCADCVATSAERAAQKGRERAREQTARKRAEQAAWRAAAYEAGVRPYRLRGGGQVPERWCCTPAGRDPAEHDRSCVFYTAG